MGFKRRETRRIYIGNVPVGGGAPISVQTMTNCPTSDVNATIAQIARVAAAGCDIVRVEVSNELSAAALPQVVESSPIPVVADIQFNLDLAFKSMLGGAAGVRINPGYLKDRGKLAELIGMAKERKVPIRIGANSGSVRPELLEKFGGKPTPEALVESVIEVAEFFEQHGFYDYKVSLKASSVNDTIEAYEIASERLNCPLHLGVTEAGPGEHGVVKSSIALGYLLRNGVGDTIRVSLTDDPVKEVLVGRMVLRSLGLLNEGIDLISCPTCGRCQVNLIEIANEVYRRTAFEKKSLKVAIMGCEVNGPGEAKEADIGIAFGKKYGVLFKKGQRVKRLPSHMLVDELLREIEGWNETKVSTDALERES